MEESDSCLPIPDWGFYIDKNNIMYSRAYIEDFTNDTLQNFPSWISQFTQKDGKWKENKKIFTYNDYENKKSFVLGGVDLYTSFQNKVLLASNVDDYFIDLTEGKSYKYAPIGFFSKNKEIFSETLNDDDTTQACLNFQALAIQTIFEDFLAIIYRFQNKKILCEIRDSKFNVIDTIDLTEMDYEVFSPFLALDKYNICIQNNQIIVPNIQNEKFIFQKFCFSKPSIK